MKNADLSTAIKITAEAFEGSEFGEHCENICNCFSRLACMP